MNKQIITTKQNLKFTVISPSQKIDSILIYFPGYTACFADDFNNVIKPLMDKNINNALIIGLDHLKFGLNKNINLTKETPDEINALINDYLDAVTNYILEYYPNKKTLFIGVSLGGTYVLYNSNLQKLIDTSILILTPLETKNIKSMWVYKFLIFIKNVLDKINKNLPYWVIKSPIWPIYITLGLIKNKRFSISNLNREWTNWKNYDINFLINFYKYLFKYINKENKNFYLPQKLVYIYISHETRIDSTKILQFLKKNKASKQLDLIPIKNVASHSYENFLKKNCCTIKDIIYKYLNHED